MASAEKPPSWVPVDQHVGQVPIAISQDIDSAGAPSGQSTDRLASQIIRDNQPVINRFIAIQRQQVELGEKDVHSSVLPLKDMDVYYQNIQGIERVHYHVTPKVEEPSPPPAPPEEIESPAPPAPEEPPTPEIETPEPEAPEPPEFKEPEPEPPPEFEEPKPPEEEFPEEEKPEKELKEPEFLEIDMPCYLPVEFGDGDE